MEYTRKDTLVKSMGFTGPQVTTSLRIDTQHMRDKPVSKTIDLPEYPLMDGADINIFKANFKVFGRFI